MLCGLTWLLVPEGVFKPSLKLSSAVTDHAFESSGLNSSRTSAGEKRPRAALRLGILSSCFAEMGTASNPSHSLVFVFMRQTKSRTVPIERRIDAFVVRHQ